MQLLSNSLLKVFQFVTIAETVLREVQGAPEKEVVDRLEIRGSQVYVRVLNSRIGHKIFQHCEMLDGTGYGITMHVDDDRPIHFPPVGKKDFC